MRPSKGAVWELRLVVTLWAESEVPGVEEADCQGYGPVTSVTETDGGNYVVHCALGLQETIAH
jgi:hypothetical protein